MSLTIENLSVGFGQRTILRGINLQLAKASFVGLIGANGSGKSTLLRAISGQIPPQSGSVKINGVDVHAERPLALTQIGYALEPSLLPARLTGHQAIALTRKILNLTAADLSLESLNVQTRLEPLLDQLIGRYSLGTQQKLAISLALIGHPALVVFDESLNGLDPRSALIVKQYLREYVQRQQATVILATHAVGAVERYCDELLIVTEQGTVTHLNPQELEQLRQSEGSMEEALIARIAAP